MTVLLESTGRSSPRAAVRRVVHGPCARGRAVDATITRPLDSHAAVVLAGTLLICEAVRAPNFDRMLPDAFVC
jgi:hypothetical protein